MPPHTARERDDPLSAYSAFVVIAGVVNIVGIFGLAILSVFTMSHAEATATFESVTASGDLLRYLFWRLPSVLVYSAVIAGATLLLSNASRVPRSLARKVGAVQFGAYIAAFVALRFYSLL